MNLNLKIYFLLIITLLGDVLTTYFVTPDLNPDYEFNPLVRVFNFGWLELFLSGTVFVFLILYFFNYSQKRINILNIKAESLGKYTSMLFYNKPFSFSILFKIPNFKQILIFSGFIIPFILVYTGFLSIVNNLFIKATYYSMFIDNIFMKLSPYHLLALTTMDIIIILLVFYFFLKKFYKQYNIVSSEK